MQQDTGRNGVSRKPEFCDRVPSHTCGVDAATRISQEIRDKAPLMLHDEDRMTAVLGG